MCPKNLLYGLFFFCCQILVRLEEEVAILPQLGGEAFEFLRVALGLRRFTTLFEITAMRAELFLDFAPDVLPDVLHAMKVVELNMGLRVDRLNCVGIGLPMIDVKGL